MDRPSRRENFLRLAGFKLFPIRWLGNVAIQGLIRKPSLVFAPPSEATPPSAAELIRQCSELLVDLRSNLERAQQRMHESANKHRRHVEFSVGDKVLRKLQPNRQHSVARPLSAKLARKYYGPF